MKKTLLALLTTIFMVLALSGCQEPLTITDYVPFPENKLYVYESDYKTDNESYPGYHLFIDYAGGDRVQRRTMIGETSIVEVLEVKDGGITVVRGLPNMYEHQDVRDLSPQMQSLVLKEPLTLGSKWVQGQTGDGTVFTMEITGMNVNVTTPMGSFKAMEVTTTSSTGDNTTKNYYVKDIGLVKTVNVSPDVVITTQLAEIKDSYNLSETVKVYQPSAEGGDKVYDEVPVTYSTNNNIVDLYNTAFAPYFETFGYTVDQNSGIENISFNYDTFVLTLNFKAGFTAQMEKASDEAEEKSNLQAIADTFGDLYNCETVIILVDQKPYASGRITMPEGEGFQTPFGWNSGEGQQ